jgi:hypothetical protein
MHLLRRSPTACAICNLELAQPIQCRVIFKSEYTRRVRLMNDLLQRLKVLSSCKRRNIDPLLPPRRREAMNMSKDTEGATSDYIETT